MGVVRTYARGPFAAIRQHVVLEPHQGGTKLVHLIGVRSHGLLGSVTAAYEVGKKTFAGLDRVYRGFDDYLKGLAAVRMIGDTPDSVPPGQRPRSSACGTPST